jgi:starch synthase (maltosyl-transferring)
MLSPMQNLSGLRGFHCAEHDAAPLRDAAVRARDLGFNSLVLRWDETSDPGLEGLEAHRALDALISAARAEGLWAGLVLAVDPISARHVLAVQTAPSAFRAQTPIAAGLVDPRRPMGEGEGLAILRRPQDPELQAWWRTRLETLNAIGLDQFILGDPTPASRCLGDALRTANLPIQTIDAMVCGGGETPHRQAVLARTAASASAWIMHAGFEEGLEAAVRAANRLVGQRSGEARALARTISIAHSSLRITHFVVEGSAVLLVVNGSDRSQPWPLTDDGLEDVGDLESIEGFFPVGDPIPAGAATLFQVKPPPAVTAPAQEAVELAAAPDGRIVIANISPSIDSGAFAVKRVIGETLEVRADIFVDGHEALRAEVLFKADDETDWRRAPMTAEPNDVWAAQIRFDRLGRHSFMIEAWLDVWGGFKRDLVKKREAGLTLDLELREGLALIAKARRCVDGPLALALGDVLAEGEAADAEQQADLFATDRVSDLMARVDDRPFRTRSLEQPVVAERIAARFSSWYELFPRSQTTDKARHGGFADVAARLPHIAAMGFDTLYFPPIHPIGRQNRKGPNNTLTAGPEDVGSPYAIGAAEGGHDAIHPQLGSLEDFRALVAAARGQGIELALDFAVQCAPDHPWLKDHPGWFDWRPDGSIKYAENPPKKYQDIVNVDFYGPDAVPGLWTALRDVVLFWAREGVRAFRVDNPHTKPLPFWKWLIAEVQARYPDAIFLAEAFTRPKPMYQLAKAGFSQSYTYFTWRTGKAEFTDYLTELTQTPVREFFRPHFFANTPDINPYFLQTAGRGGFLIRAALAATLSGLFGIYAGFELCESAPLPGREEYLDSEKYQIRPRPDRAPGDIVDEIAQLNGVRRAEPALQTHLNLAFHNAFNDQILYFSKRAPGQGDLILVAVSLDPRQPQEADIEVPLWLFGLADHQSVQVEDLLGGRRFRWTGKVQRLRLTPDHPYALWRIAPLKDA